MKYIEQVDNSKYKGWLYFPIPLLFFGIMLMNYISTSDLDTAALIQSMIDKIGTNLTFVFLVAPLSVACLFLLFWVKFVHQQSLTQFNTSRNKIDWNRVFFSFFLWGGIVILMTAISYWMEPETFVFNFNASKFFVFLVIAILLIPLQTSFEEYLFRGYLMQGLGVATKTRWFPLVFTSVLFGLMHIANPEVEKLGYVIMIYYIGTGFVLGIMTLMDEGIELALGFHAANNLVTALLVTSDWTAFQTHSIYKQIGEPEVGFSILIPVLIIFPIVLFIFGKKYNWSQWKQRLFLYSKP
jgi:membrane protease YdiL (CAAX protease family)